MFDLGHLHYTHDWSEKGSHLCALCVKWAANRKMASAGTDRRSNTHMSVGRFPNHDSRHSFHWLTCGYMYARTRWMWRMHICLYIFIPFCARRSHFIASAPQWHPGRQAIVYLKQKNVKVGEGGLESAIVAWLMKYLRSRSDRRNSKCGSTKWMHSAREFPATCAFFRGGGGWALEFREWPRNGVKMGNWTN
jgi:hypothetical protein